MEIEGVEQQIFLQPEMAIVGAVYSVNGYTGHVVLTTSDLENTSDYQTSTDVAALISAHNTSEEAHPYIQALISSKQDPIVAGNGISITGGNTIAIDTTVVATQQNLATEVTNRENADIALQGQIDAISASSDVVDIVGTYAELQNYDTAKLKDNDIIKVLQDSTQGNATTYYRWSTTTQSFTLIGQEGPYYTKAAADAQFVPQTRTINSKPLSANITLTASDVSALGQSDVVQTTGTSTSQVMSQNAVTTALATKLDIEDVPAGFFDGAAIVSPIASTSVQLANSIKMQTLQLLGDTIQQTYSGINLLSSPQDYTEDINGLIISCANGIYNMSGQASSSNSSSIHSVIYPYTIKSGDYLHLNNDFVSTRFQLALVFSDNTIFNKAPNALNKIFSLDDVVGKQITGIRFYFNAGYTIEGTMKPMVINGISTVTEFQPYVGGGIPSPNPDFPQDVDVVTGTQTITVSDDDNNSQTYTINLGNTELCKIGTYQDYIYKNGADWYVHKTIEKVIFDGSETNWNTNVSLGMRQFYKKLDVDFNTDSAARNLAKSDNFTNGTSTNRFFIADNLATGVVFRQPESNGTLVASTVAEWETWLSTHNTSLYYILATPTDTQIIDTVLTNQLEALLNATLYQSNTTISSSGSLPAILGITAYSTNLNGILALLSNSR